MNEFEKIKEKIIRNAQNELHRLSYQGVEIKSNDYRDFLHSMASGKCRTCKKPLEVIYAEENENSYKYKFACGHGSNGITINETLTIKDSFKLRKNKTGIKRFIYEFISGWFPSNRKDLSPKGVTKIRVIDREKDYYKEEIIDEMTGKMIRSIEEKLTEHIKRS
jgi:hypothetical protein